MKPHLKAANDLRQVKAKCLPLFDLAKNQSPAVKEQIYAVMVLQIADTLGTIATEDDLEIRDRLWWRKGRRTRVVHLGPVVRMDPLDALRFVSGAAA